MVHSEVERHCQRTLSMVVARRGLALTVLSLAASLAPASVAHSSTIPASWMPASFTLASAGQISAGQVSAAQKSSEQGSIDHRKIVFPNVPGYTTLKTDLHTHSVFSDGVVWPTVRVAEALLDGLDAISLTEHLEYQPHEDDIPHPDRNRAHQIALKSVADINSSLLVIPGSEVTRKLPPGHINAIFVKDSNRLLLDDPMEVLREARRQGAYIFWNHPNWIGQRDDGVATLTDFHRTLIAEGLLQGIEVVNDHTFSDEALEIALEKGLAVIGTSDIHDLVDWRYKIPQGGHRPITLVFAKQRSLDGIHEALLARRTVAWFDDLLVGEATNLEPLLEAIVTIAGPSLYRKTSSYGETRATSVLAVSLVNNSSARMILENISPFRFHNSAPVFTLEPRHTTTLELKTGARDGPFALELRVLSALVAPATHPTLSLRIEVASQ